MAHAATSSPSPPAPQNAPMEDVKTVPQKVIEALYKDGLAVIRIPPGCKGGHVVELVMENCLQHREIPIIRCKQCIDRCHYCHYEYVHQKNGTKICGGRFKKDEHVRCDGENCDLSFGHDDSDAAQEKHVRCTDTYCYVEPEDGDHDGCTEGKPCKLHPWQICMRDYWA